MYDDASNLLTAKDADGTYTFSYDALNRAKTSVDLWNLTLTFSFNAVQTRQGTDPGVMSLGGF